MFIDMPMGGAAPCRVANIDHVPSDAELSEMVSHGVAGFELSTAGAMRSLDWLADLDEVRFLSASLAPGSRVPQNVLRKVERLYLGGTRVRLGVPPEELLMVRDLEVPAGAVEGSFARCPALACLTLRTFPYADLRVLDGCDSLTKANLNGRGAEVRLELDGLLPNLTYLQTAGLWPLSLSGVGALPSLRVLQMGVGRPRPRAVPLDLSPLAVCRDLRVVTTENLGPFTGRAAIEELPQLVTLRIS